MANLPKGPAGRHSRSGFDLRWPEAAERSLSFDGTRKYLFRLNNGASVEAVYLPEGDRRTICISTQAGCPLSAFSASRASPATSGTSGRPRSSDRSRP